MCSLAVCFGRSADRRAARAWQRVVVAVGARGRVREEGGDFGGGWESVRGEESDGW